MRCCRHEAPFPILSSNRNSSSHSSLVVSIPFHYSADIRMNVIGICHHPRWDSFPPVFFCRQFGREVRDANQRFRCFYTGTRSICVRTIDASEVTWRANQFASTLCGDRALLTRTAFPTPPRFSASIRSLTVKPSRRSLLSEPRSDTCRS